MEDRILASPTCLVLRLRLRMFHLRGSCVCGLQYSATLRWRKGGQELGFGPMLDPSVARGFTRPSFGPAGGEDHTTTHQGTNSCATSKAGLGADVEERIAQIERMT